MPEAEKQQQRFLVILTHFGSFVLIHLVLAGQGWWVEFGGLPVGTD